jgi:hypothetical protein
MVDMSQTIAPKSDQLNADDLIGRTLTVKVTKVSGCPEPQQPIAVNFEGDNAKPYKPCKSMRRVMVQVWGKDGQSYIGKSMTLYRDPEVVFGGMAVGGIRISHMSDIKEPITLALTASKASRKPFTVKPLKVDAAPPSTTAPRAGQLPEGATELANDLVAIFNDAADAQAHAGFLETNQEQIAWLKQKAPSLWNGTVAPAIQASYDRNSIPVENDPTLATGVEGY